jgi:hypothetical protein
MPLLWYRIRPKLRQTIKIQPEQGGKVLSSSQREDNPFGTNTTEE